MRIACVDKAAGDRVRLVQQIEGAFVKCRSAIGHLAIFQPLPASKEELLASGCPEAVVLGAAFSPDESYLACRDIRRAHPQTAIIALLHSENFTFGTLQRFEKIADHVLTVEENSARIVHIFTSIAAKCRVNAAHGKLVTVSGVKGGVGTTSVVSGLAHAAQAKGLSSVVLDLSASGTFLSYMMCPRRQSSEYAAFLLDGIIPDADTLRRCIVSGPNGLQIMLPPAGSSEIRELWLRDASKFEITLAVLELLSEMFDAVLVDLASAEGVLRFALLCRAAANIVVSSTEPASVHLLGHELTTISNCPGDAQLLVVINQIQRGQLSLEDVTDYLSLRGELDSKPIELRLLKYDGRGRNWIGTGNTFYTESARRTRENLERILHFALDRQTALSGDDTPVWNFSLFASMKNLISPPALKRFRPALTFGNSPVPLLAPPRAPKQKDSVDQAHWVFNDQLRDAERRVHV